MSEAQYWAVLGGCFVIPFLLIAAIIARVDGWRTALFVMFFTLVLLAITGAALYGWVAFVLVAVS